MSKSVKKRVEATLRKYDSARNSDTKLHLLICWNYYPEFCMIDDSNNLWVKGSGLTVIPSYASISRCRRKFNQEGQYLATDSVVLQRRSKERAMRDGMPQHRWGEAIETIA